MATRTHNRQADSITVHFALMRAAQLRGDTKAARKALGHLQRLGVKVDFASDLPTAQAPAPLTQTDGVPHASDQPR